MAGQTDSGGPSQGPTLDPSVAVHVPESRVASPDGAFDAGLVPEAGQRAARYCLACAEPYLFDTLAHMAIWDQLLERAAEQHGYVTTRDARDLGIDPTQLRLLAARGRLERVGRGAYRVPVLPRGEHDELAEAVAWSLGRGVVSHESALVLRGLSDVNPSRVHLTVPRDNHPRAAGGDLYRLHRRALPASDVTEADGIPVTTVPRTVRDCLADGTDPYQLRLAIDRAEAEGIVRRAAADELRNEVAAVGTAVQA